LFIGLFTKPALVEEQAQIFLDSSLRQNGAIVEQNFIYPHSKKDGGLCDGIIQLK
jgi:hypothetical protein